MSAYQCYDENDDASDNMSSVDLDPDFWYHIHGPPPMPASWEVGDINSAFGLTPVSASPVVNCSIILQEQIRDYVAQLQQLGAYGPAWGAHPRGQTHDFIEPRIIAHEIAHQFGIVGHEVATLVSEWVGQDLELSAGHINSIRSSSKLAEE